MKEIGQLVDAFAKYPEFGAQRMFSYFLDACMKTLGKKVPEKLDSRTEEAVLEICNTYSKMAYNTPPCTDILGPVYQMLTSAKAKSSLGAFYTPEHLSMLCNKIAIENIVPLFEKEDVVKISEPTIGGGSMVLEAMKYLASMNPEYLKKLHVKGVDIDLACCKISSIQMFSAAYFHEMQLHRFDVYNGNTLGPLDKLSLYWGYSTTKPDSR